MVFTTKFDKGDKVRFVPYKKNTEVVGVIITIGISLTDWSPDPMIKYGVKYENKNGKAQYEDKYEEQLIKAI